jgi:hypothetical protein
VDLKPSAMRDGKARLKNRQFYQIPKNNQVSIMALALRGGAGMVIWLLMLYLKIICFVPLIVPGRLKS